ncbi:MAG: thioredoxin family protein [Bacilli bacterium]|nr:thioredoxin family protein [Bacilli bacterium]
MKKFLIFSLLILLAGCSKLTTYKEINYKKLTSKLDNSESFILFIGSSTCSHCDNFKKTINSVIKDYQVEVYYIDISKLSDNEKNLISSKIQFKYTPTTIFIEKGVASSDVTKRIVGEASYDKVVKKLKANGYIER